MNVLALEPWYGGSHRRFLDGLAHHSRHTFRLATMENRYWKWRMQGGAVTLAAKAREVAEGGFAPDLIFASSMVNLPAFLALTRERFAATPVVLYFHENQLTYPLRPPDAGGQGEARDFTYAYINYLSALAADRVVFNSAFHRNEFFEALPELLRRFPDYTHLRTAQRLRDKSSVLHLGLDLDALDRHAGQKRDDGPGAAAPIVLWNQRWEHDKNPEAFFRTMNRLDDAGCPFRLILAGERFEVQPPAFETAFRRYADRILHYGYAENLAEYAGLLHRADLVVSTARHEFFGVALMEAIRCGCHPLLPNRLTYPELVPEALHRPLLHAPVLYESDDDLFEILRRVLTGEERPLPEAVLAEIPEPLAWPMQVRAYDALFEAVTEAPPAAVPA